MKYLFLKNMSRMVVILAAFVGCAGCGGGGADGGDSAPSDTTPPVAVVSPASGSPIGDATPIQIRFSESMDTGSVVVGGTLAGEADAGAWTKTNSADDTLSIAPVTKWSSGSAKTLTVDGTDLAGNSLSRLSATYDVDTTAPSWNVAPATASTISRSAQIVISFSETMKADSLVLGGTMATESDGGVWSNATVANDTLTLSPSVFWSGGGGTLSVTAADLAGNAAPAIDLNYTVDATLATAVASPQNGSVLATDQGVTITFSKSMNAATLILGGTLAGEAGQPLWSMTAVANDTLTIDPATQWSVGEVRVLTINAADIQGNAIQEINLVYDAGVLFVSVSGNDGNAGSKSYPLKTISAALAVAGYPELHVQGGIFPETVSITSGRTIIGSYDPNWTTTDVLLHPTRITGAAAGSLIVQNATSAVNVSTLEVDGVDATTPSASSFAIRVLNSPGPISFQTLVIVGASGANGQNGSQGTSVAGIAATGSSGQDAISGYFTCNSTSRGWGGAGAGAGAAAGGAGGDGGTMDTSCITIPYNYNATAGIKGAHAVVFITNSLGDGGVGGPACSPGADGHSGQYGQNGHHGIGGSGGSLSYGLWIPASGTTGGLGTDGGGGGGGGGSGGCDSGTDSYGAGGGGGGAGGARASSGGTGGTGGGASFGILVDNSTVEVSASSVVIGRGGMGGAGGGIGYGQTGGDGGFGGAAAGGSYPGGTGGRGGNGGNSGSGGGGAGGNAYGIYQSGSTVTLTNVTYTGGAAGVGGIGGSGLSNQGAAGTVLQQN